MRINEVEEPTVGEDPNKLLGLVNFLSGRASDTNAQKQISQQAFIQAAQSLGINITPTNLADIVGRPPLSNVLVPLQPDSTDPIQFKTPGGPEGDVEMPVNKAQDIVAKAASSAAKKDRGI